jgi:hypothetical protein
MDAIGIKLMQTSGTSLRCTAASYTYIHTKRNRKRRKGMKKEKRGGGGKKAWRKESDEGVGEEEEGRDSAWEGRGIVKIHV